ncbi:MAG TPA: ergothioneine biosynthesis protein EgtB, partial [Kofleriaceae bacterium]|nr:ergothioneine biosynthesis protein EgtB [Kofleriaceae bacterium]
TVEDQVIQAMPDASPTKWHLAHTSWFFETVVVEQIDPTFNFLFNSYYEALGPRVERARRGLLSRPTLDEVHAYRARVDRHMHRALAEGSLDDDALARVELGLHHEQQHQELILTDIKYALGTQPLRPAYRDDLHTGSAPLAASSWRRFEGGVVEIGDPGTSFAFDNERPRHAQLVEPFQLATRPLANADVLEFIADGGYRDPRWWLSDGWHVVRTEGWVAPLHWHDGEIYTLGGMRAIDAAETACHLSYYEVDAIARWRGARLPTEAEWEIAASALDPEDGNFAEDDRLHPGVARVGLGQMFGDVWEWTSSSFLAYRGFRPWLGALAEYNSKFMSGQHVLRGGSCLTPRGHVRATYRNFFPPGARWQMTGARLATDG